jgi:hypothetical protein
MKDNECRSGCLLVKILAVIGAITVIAGIAYAVYRYFTPDYLEDLEDDFDDYFEDDDEFVDEDDPMIDFDKDENEE